ncbi:MAG TPA: hypothetical protein VG604_01400 [Candidatus Saccharimonadales bacterium]|nr:hypothetical protein [Candidatus Saccharimonadales bacterium]
MPSEGFEEFVADQELEKAVLASIDDKLGKVALTGNDLVLLTINTVAGPEGAADVVSLERYLRLLTLHQFAGETGLGSDRTPFMLDYHKMEQSRWALRDEGSIKITTGGCIITEVGEKRLRELFAESDQLVANEASRQA